MDDERFEGTFTPEPNVGEEPVEKDPVVETPVAEKVNPYMNVQPAMNYQASVKKAKKEKKEKKFFSKLVLAMVLGLSFGVFAAGGFYGVSRVIGDTPGTQTSVTENADISALEKKIEELQKELSRIPSTTNVVTEGQATNLSYVTTDVTAVVDKVMPAMVSVTNVYETTTTYWGRTYTKEEESCGSGIIVGESDTEYFIATNYHVIQDAKKLTVQLADESTATAYVKGYVEDIDIAVISIQKADLSADTIGSITVAEMGDSDNLKIGEPAIAIGNALGYGQSVTTGVISALNREIDLENSSSSLIQTSAAINPGNSGGALLNIYGQVIGINSSKIGATTVEGIGFAIPIDEVKDIIGELSARVTKVKVSEDERGYLGVSCYDGDLTSIGYPAGVLVRGVNEGSPADVCGILPYDIITKIDGQKVSSFNELSTNLAYYKAGDTIEIVVRRSEQGVFKEYTLTVTLGVKDVLDYPSKEITE